VPRSLSLAMILTFSAALSASTQSQEGGAPASPTPSQDSSAAAETKKPKKVWTNENISGANGTVSVVGDPKNKPKPALSKPVDAQYVASVRKQLDKLQAQIDDIDKQLADLKNFSEGKPSTSASGMKLNKGYEREPIEVQIRALQAKKKDLESRVDTLLDEARKKGVESSQLR